MADQAPKTSNAGEPLNKPPRTEVRYLTPDTCIIHVGSYNALHVTIKNEWVYGGVYAVYAFLETLGCEFTEPGTETVPKLPTLEVAGMFVSVARLLAFGVALIGVMLVSGALSGIAAWAWSGGWFG